MKSLCLLVIFLRCHVKSAQSIKDYLKNLPMQVYSEASPNKFNGTCSLVSGVRIVA